MEWLMAIMGIASLVGSLIYGSQQKKQEQETQNYNKELNQTVMDREDNAWQRAVEDRSKSGLSVAGLSQGAGSGGSVSQLQAPQGNAVMANLMQNISGQSFGLASSAYESRKNRELQKENFEAELRLKKEQLDTDILNAQYQRMKMLAEIQGLNDENIRQQGIYTHNMSIARGDQKNPLYRVYGSQPSEIESLLTGIINNREKIKDSVSETFENVKDKVKDFFNGTPRGAFYDVPSDKIQAALGDFTINKLTSPVTNIAKSSDGKSYYLVQDDGQKIELSKYQYNNMCKLIGRPIEK